MSNYSDRDTYADTDVPSGLPRGHSCDDMPTPDSRGFGAGIPDHDFATGPVVLRGGERKTRASGPTYGVGQAGPDPAP